MPADSLLYRRLADELNRRLTGGRIDKVVMPDKSALMLFIRASGKNYNLIITAATQPRCYLTKEKLTAAATPPAFCLHLRKHLGGGIIKSVSAIPFERILLFELTSFGDLGEPRERRMYVELMGKYSNVVITDGENRITDALKHISADEGRPVLPGFPFTTPSSPALYPDDTDRIREMIHGAEDAEKALMNIVRGIAPATAKEAASAGGDIAKNLLDLINAENKPTVYYIGETAKDFSFCEYLTVAGQRKYYESISEAMDAYYVSRGAFNNKSEVKTMLSRAISGALEKQKKKLGGFMLDLENASDYESERIIGELITSNLYKIKKGDKAVTVLDWYTNEERTIPLDDGNPSQCAEKHFNKYQKKKRTIERMHLQISETETQIDYLESIMQALETSDDAGDLAEIESELESAGLLKSQNKRRQADTSKPRKFDIGGYELLVGKSNLQNDQITKAAKGEDIWLHTQGIHGSHAVLCTRGKAPDMEIIRQAAQAAAFFSKARMSQNVPVDYTKVKNVRKPKGSPPGKVEYVNQKTIYVDPVPPKS